MEIKVENPNTIHHKYSNNIKAVNDIIEQYTKIGNIRHVLLLSQMQSGKTTTFLLLASEMIRRELIEKVVIFSGNREIDLKNQIKKNKDDFFETNLENFKEHKFYYIKYLQYLNFNNDNLNIEDFIYITQEIENKIEIIWGTELNKFSKKFKKYLYQTKKNNNINNKIAKTLWIHEESHYAQDIQQQVDKFLQKLEITPNGDFDLLNQKGYLYLSVSATPFSELVDANNLEQNKTIVKMKCGLNYKGVEFYFNNNRIIGFNKWKETLIENLNYYKNQNKFAILRISKYNIELIENIIKENNWDFKYFIDETNSKLYPNINNLKILENEPIKPCVIIIKQKCRMGTDFCKKYISFMMELNKNSNADTLLQGLLGRACGYFDNDNIYIYLNKNILKNKDIEKYINLFNDNNNFIKNIPNKARNLIKIKNQDFEEKINNEKIENIENQDFEEKINNENIENIENQDFEEKINNENIENIKIKKKYYKVPFIPIKISKEYISVNFEETEALYNDIKNAIEMGTIENYNENYIINLILLELNKIFESFEIFKNNIIKRRLNNKNKTYQKIPEIIYNSIINKKPPINIGSGCGRTKEQNIIIYYIDSNEYEENYNFKKGDYYLIYFKEKKYNKNFEIKRKTTKKEIFYHKLENNKILETNGVYLIPLKIESSYNEEIMLEQLEKFIILSKNSNYPRFITSIRDDNDWKGIWISKDIYNSLNINGNIYNRILENLNVKIKIKKTRGKLPINKPDYCDYRLEEISW